MSVDVQLENGHTRIAHELLEKLAKVRLSPTQYRMILVIWRYTYGFQRKEHNMSLKFLSDATGCDKRQIQRYLKDLEERKFINQRIKYGSYRLISFNKNYNEWVTTVGDSTNGNSTNGETTVGENVNSTVGDSTNKTVGDSTNQDIYKDKSKDNNTDPVRFYSDNIGMIKPYIVQIIEHWEKDLSSELVVEALKRTLKQNKRSINYAEGIMKNWLHEGIKTLDDLVGEEQEKQKQKHQPPQLTEKQKLEEELEAVKTKISLGRDYWIEVKNKPSEFYDQLVKREEEIHEQLRVH